MHSFHNRAPRAPSAPGGGLQSPEIVSNPAELPKCPTACTAPGSELSYQQSLSSDGGQIYRTLVDFTAAPLLFHPVPSPWALGAGCSPCPDPRGCDCPLLARGHPFPWPRDRTAPSQLPLCPVLRVEGLGQALNSQGLASDVAQFCRGFVSNAHP